MTKYCYLVKVLCGNWLHQSLETGDCILMDLCFSFFEVSDHRTDIVRNLCFSNGISMNTFFSINQQRIVLHEAQPLKAFEYPSY